MPQHHDQHWIQSVTELGDRHAIIAQRDIRAEGGMKLVARGTPADGRMRERLDGSGYPHGLAGAGISSIGRLLAVAEVTASRFDHEGRCNDPQSMGTLLKLNTHKLDPRFTRLLAPIYRRPVRAADGEEETEPFDLAPRLRTVAELFQQWEEATAAQAGRDGAALETAIFDFIIDQVWALRTQLLDAGFNPRDPDTVLELVAEDAAFLEEVADLLDEALWQLDSLAREVTRRWPEVLTQMGSECPLLRWLTQAQEARRRAAEQSEETDLSLEDLNGPAQ